MAKSNLASKAVKESGAPSFLISSLVTATPFLFVLLGSGLVQGTNNTALSSTLLALICEGVAVSFFWRRLAESPGKTFAAVWFTLGLWGFMAACLANSILDHFMPGIPSAYFASLFGQAMGLTSGAFFALLWAFGHSGGQQIRSLIMTTAATAMAIGIAVTDNGYLVESSGMDMLQGARHGGHGEESAHGHDSMATNKRDSDTVSADDADHELPKALGHGEGGHYETAAAARLPAEHGSNDSSHWTYDGDTGPENWGNIREEWATCAVGEEQSPVDIPRTAKEYKGNIILAYQAMRAKVIDNGHTIQVNLPKGSRAVINSKTYELKQFHFHAPSEHEINGVSFPLEVHFVHADRQGHLAVIAAFIEKGALNREFAKVLKAMPDEPGAPAETQALNLGDILPKNRVVYQYPGSLTTPPCTEGVLWSMMKTPIAMSASQIAALKDRYTNTNRPVQPMNGRSFNKPADRLAH